MLTTTCTLSRACLDGRGLSTNNFGIRKQEGKFGHLGTKIPPLLKFLISCLTGWQSGTPLVLFPKQARWPPLIIIELSRKGCDFLNIMFFFSNSYRNQDFPRWGQTLSTFHAHDNDLGTVHWKQVFTFSKDNVRNDLNSKWPHFGSH